MSEAIEKKQHVLAVIRNASQNVTLGLEEFAQLLSREDLTVGQVATAFHLAKVEWAKPMEDILKMAREGLLERVADEGEKDPELPEFKQTLKTVFNGRKFTLTRLLKRSSSPDEGLLRALLKRKGIKPEACFVEQVSLVLSQEKLQELVDKKKLSQEDIDACRKVISPQLTVASE